ncbi:MAG: FapA family protein [Oscillospiraceae bacterium]
MKNDCQGLIQIEDLLCDDVMRAHLSTSYNKQLILHQLLDPTLMGIDLDEICEMDMETLVSDVLQTQELVLTEQADFVASEESEQAKKARSSVKITAVPDEYTDGEKLIRISFNQSMVEAHIFIENPPEGQAPPTEHDIRTALLRKKVVYGIKEDYIDRLVQHPVYNRKIKIAQGTAPLQGVDGSVTYNFKPVIDLAPTIDEHGIADFKALNIIQSVKKGDLLCTIIRSSTGTSGISVCGDVLTGKSGRPSGIVCGVNTVLSDDRTKLYASCDGQAFLRGRTVYVGRILEVDNVDSSTGNILFVGSVHIKGDVASGFSVRVGGNITIDGVAENAVLVAGNDIVISNGIKGNDKALIIADGNIRSLYIENARVQAKGNIYADTILNSNVESTRSINLSGINGKIIGGTCTAGETIIARQIGNDSCQQTTINVSDPDTFGKSKAKNMLSIAKYKESIAMLKNVAEFAAASHLDVMPPEVMLCRAVVTKIRLERAIDVLEMQNAETNEIRRHRRHIEVKETIFPNVNFIIDDTTHKNDVKKPSCSVLKVNGKIVYRAY